MSDDGTRLCISIKNTRAHRLSLAEELGERNCLRFIDEVLLFDPLGTLATGEYTRRQSRGFTVTVFIVFLLLLLLCPPCSYSCSEELETNICMKLRARGPPLLRELLLVMSSRNTEGRDAFRVGIHKRVPSSDKPDVFLKKHRRCYRNAH